MSNAHDLRATVLQDRVVLHCARCGASREAGKSSDPLPSCPVPAAREREFGKPEVYVKSTRLLELLRESLEAELPKEVWVVLRDGEPLAFLPSEAEAEAWAREERAFSDNFEAAHWAKDAPIPGSRILRVLRGFDWSLRRKGSEPGGDRTIENVVASNLEVELVPGSGNLFVGSLQFLHLDSRGKTGAVDLRLNLGNVSDAHLLADLKECLYPEEPGLPPPTLNLEVIVEPDGRSERLLSFRRVSSPSGEGEET